jgi:ADP-dependent NAD(P)H-hydrate dehydratase / NAD(P)H-hydrate epimerase
LRLQGLAADTGREETLAALSAKGICVVLKGHHTLVADITGSIYINPTGNPGLAQGGSGDVLAGFLTGWLAQPSTAEDPLRAIRYAVWEHGASADRLEAQRQNWTAEDLADTLRG